LSISGHSLTNLDGSISHARNFAIFSAEIPKPNNKGATMTPSSSSAAPSGAAASGAAARVAAPAANRSARKSTRRLTRHRKEVNAMLRKLQELLSSRNPELEQPQFNGQLLDQNREDVYTLMHQQMSSMR
jgi:hypothetical protein